MNKVMLIGNLTKDPELINTNSGIAVCRFTLAVSRRFQNSNGERETDFLNIVVWRQQGENCAKYLRKGSKCCVIGAIQTRSYEAQDGSKRYITEITADEVEFLTSKSASAEYDNMPAPFSGKTEKKDVSELEPIEDDSLPF
ncbi:MAG: single-stranded DNA-binding protein [Clostridia bacterium]|nr:single-stranded DNA-binding protein [Clostridia bacterium]